MNWIRYIDCMDKEKGLPSLPDKSIDLCLTDPPWGVNFKKVNTIQKKPKRKTHLFDDTDFVMDWFNICKRKCNMIIFSCGLKNLGKLMYQNKDLYLFIWHNPLKQGQAFNSKVGGHKIEPWLTWNIKLSKNIIRLVPKDRPLGFYNGKNLLKTNHPCPKDSSIIEWFLEDLKPKSVIDPFMGSGTTAEICLKLSIPYCGYEKEIQYKMDIDNRIKRGIYFKGQTKLDSFTQKNV